jgi:PAS domain S-box-containing protein
MTEKPTYEELERRVQELEKIQSELEYSKEALRESESLFKMLYEKAPLGYQSLDENGHFIVVNQTWLDTLGYTREEVIGKSFADFLHSDWRDHFKENFPRFKSIGEVLEVEFEIVKKNGDLILVSFTGKISRDKKGDFQQTHCIFHDITERKRAEEILRESEKKLRATLDATPFPIAVVDLQDDKIFFWSRSALELFGHTARTASEWYQMAYPDPDYRQDLIEKWKPFLEKARNSDQTVNAGERRIACKDGSECICEIYATFLPDNLIITFNNITERKKADIEREKLQTQLNQAQKLESVGRLAGGVAHDFNNMLGVILGHTEQALLLAGEKHELYSDLKEIQKAAKCSADITKQLLAFARKEIISPKQLDLNDTVESMLNMLHRLIGEDIDLVWKPSSNLWPIKMDPSQIDQILVNLCVNARDAIDGVGKITIETGRKSFDEGYCKDHAGFIPGDFVLLAVSDNGCGMDKEILDNLFEPFFTTKDVGKGTGLGLATVYGIIQQNNGFIIVYSEPGQGSTFQIYLPRLVAEEDTDKAVPEKKTVAGGSDTILLVEDEPAILEITRMMLERNGYTVLSAGTPTEAMEKTKNHSVSIDLLMTDVVMPEMNGRDLAEKIIALHPDIKLLFMSGYTEDIIAHQGVLDDGVAFIQKPFSMGDLTKKLQEILKKISGKT